jgi:hypothetical protein
LWPDFAHAVFTSEKWDSRSAAAAANSSNTKNKDNNTVCVDGNITSFDFDIDDDNNCFFEIWNIMIYYYSSLYET